MLALRVPHEDAFEGVSSDCPNPDELKELITQVLERAKVGGGSEYGMLKDAVSLENDSRNFHATHSFLHYLRIFSKRWAQEKSDYR